MLFDLGAHLVDQALVLFGVPAIGLGECARGTGRGHGLMMPSTCTCTILRRTPRRPPPFPDQCLRGSGCGCAPPAWHAIPDARFTLNGTQGTFRKFGIDCQEAHLLAGDMFSSKPWGVEGPEHWGTLTLDEGGEPVSTRIPTEAGDYRGYYINLRDAIHGNAALEVTPLQAWRTMRVLEMAVESSHTGSTVTLRLEL